MRGLFWLMVITLLALVVATGHGPRLVNRVATKQVYVTQAIANRDSLQGDVRLRFTNESEVSLSVPDSLRTQVQALEDGEILDIQYLLYRQGQEYRGDTTWLSSKCTVVALECPGPVLP